MSRIPLWTSLLPYITVLKWESNMFSAVLSVHTPVLKLQHADSSLPGSLRLLAVLVGTGLHGNGHLWTMSSNVRVGISCITRSLPPFFSVPCVTYYRASLLDVHGHGKPIIAFHWLLPAEPRANVVFTLTLTPPGTVRNSHVRHSTCASSRTAATSSSTFKCHRV